MKEINGGEKEVEEERKEGSEEGRHESGNKGKRRRKGGMGG